MDDRVRPSLGPRIICMVAVAPIAATMGGLAMGLAHDVTPPVALCTALLSVALVWIAVTVPRSRAGAMTVSVVGGIGAGILNTPASFVTMSLLGRPGYHLHGLMGDTVLATVLGAIYAAPLGLLFGAIYLVPVASAHRLSRDRSVEALDRSLATTGTWMAVVALLCGLVAAALAPTRSTSTVVAMAMVALAVLGVGAAVYGQVRAFLRRRWFAAICEGRNPGWVVTRADPLVPWDAALPPLFAGACIGDGVLARRVDGPTFGAYRSSERLEPWAVVDLPEASADDA